MTDKPIEYKCKKCGVELSEECAQTRAHLCKTCELKLMYGVSNNKRRFRRKK